MEYESHGNYPHNYNKPLGCFFLKSYTKYVYYKDMYIYNSTVKYFLNDHSLMNNAFIWFNLLYSNS